MASSKSSMPLFVSFYTEGTPYEELARRLRINLDAFGIRHEIRGRPDLGSWVRNCGQKGPFCREIMDELDRPLVWLDLDGELVARPMLFEQLALDPTVDIGVYINHKASDEGASRLISSVIFMSGSTACRKVLRLWETLCRKYPKVWDQVLLRHAIKSLKPQTFELPDSYCARYRPREEPEGWSSPPPHVIRQYQVSRAARGKRLSVAHPDHVEIFHEKKGREIRQKVRWSDPDESKVSPKVRDDGEAVEGRRRRSAGRRRSRRMEWSLADQLNATRLDVLFVTNRGYQFRELGIVGRALAARGCSVAALDFARNSDGALACAARAAGLPVIDLDTYARGHYRPGMLVVRSEIHRRVRDLLAHANEVGIPTVAIAHPVVDFRPRRKPYVVSSTVLCAGPFTARRFHGRRLVITGYPGFDEMPQVSRDGPAAQRVVVNLPVARRRKRQEVRDRWMNEVEAVCRAASLPFVVSCHPRDVAPQRSWPVDSRPVYDLLAEATLLVSPPSTVLLEALQMGVPGVCHRPPAGTIREIDTFDEPLGAFRNTVGAEALAEAVAEARTRAGRARETAKAFLAEHVSSKPDRSMTQRVVDALLEILKGL